MELVHIKSPSDIGALIKVRRKALGLSQSVLSSIAGVPQPNLSKIERGESSATMQTYLKLSEPLGIDLFGGVRQ